MKILAAVDVKPRLADVVMLSHLLHCLCDSCLSNMHICMGSITISLSASWI